MLSLRESNTITFLEVISVSLTYGISLVLFFNTLRELLNAYRVNRRMVILVLTFFVLSTVGIVTDVYGIILSHDKADEIRGVPNPPRSSPLSDWYRFTPRPVLVIAYIAYTGLAVLADGVLVYRCYRVWNSKLVIILPLMLWLGLLATAIGATIVTGLMSSPSMIRAGNVWFRVVLCMSLATNLIATGLLAYKLYKESLIHGMSTPFIRRIGIVILESGIIYSVFLVVSIVMCLTNVPYRKIFVDMVNNIIPITFYLIILRLGQAHGIDPDCQGLESGLVFASAPTSAGLSQSCLSNHGMQSIVAGETKSVPVEPIPTQKGPTYTSHPPNVTRPGTSSSTTSASKQVSLDLVV